MTIFHLTLVRTLQGRRTDIFYSNKSTVYIKCITTSFIDEDKKKYIRRTYLSGMLGDRIVELYEAEPDVAKDEIHLTDAEIEEFFQNKRLQREKQITESKLCDRVFGRYMKPDENDFFEVVVA